jgi:hypothetical protein
MSSGISKITTERNQRTLLELVMQPGNGNATSQKLLGQFSMNLLLSKIFVQIVGHGTRDGLLTIWAFSYGMYDTRFRCVLADVHQMQRQLREHPSQAWYSYHESVRQKNT